MANGRLDKEIIAFPWAHLQSLLRCRLIQANEYIQYFDLPHQKISARIICLQALVEVVTFLSANRQYLTDILVLVPCDSSTLR